MNILMPIKSASPPLLQVDLCSLYLDISEWFFCLFVCENGTMGKGYSIPQLLLGSKREGITSFRHILLILQWSSQIECESHYLRFAFRQGIEKEEQELRWKFFCRGHVWHPPKSSLHLRTTSPQLSF